jgi:hypothetical protein
MKPLVLLFASSLVGALVISCVSNSTMALGAGSGNEGEARTVCGIIANENGVAAVNIEVRLLPADYNPLTGDTIKPLSKKTGLDKLYSARKNWDSLQATTDRQGYFEMKNVPFNTYSLVNAVDDSLNRKIFAKVVVDSSDGPLIELDTIHEKQPGHIQLTLLDSVAALNLSMVLLGTGIRLPITHAGAFTLSAPAGTLQVVFMRPNSVSGAFEPVFMYDNIVVQENRTTRLGDGIGFEKRANN